MNIFRRELKANLKSLLIWIGIMLLFTVIGFSKFSAYYNNPELLAILNDMPAAVVDALSLNAFNLTTVTGFFGLMFTYYALMLSIAAAMWGSDLVSKEERDKTVEFSLSLPITRAQLVTGKALAAAVNCVVLLLVTWGAVAYGSSNYSPGAGYYPFVARSMLALFVLQLVFLAIGLLLGCAMKQYKRVGSVAIGVLLTAYILSVIVSLDQKLDFLHYLSPFTYFKPASMLSGAGLEPAYLALSVGIVAVSLVAAYMTFSRRDLYI